MTATVDLSSVDTNHPDRDAHLRSTDFFDVETNPQMQFVSTSVTPFDDGYVMTGDLTLNGITRPLELPVEFHGVEEYMGKELHAGFSGQGELRRSEFGIDFGILPLGGDRLALADVVKIELDVQFVAPAGRVKQARTSRRCRPIPGIASRPWLTPERGGAAVSPRSSKRVVSAGTPRAERTTCCSRRSTSR